MKKSKVEALCKEFGEFYIYFEPLRKKTGKVTYRQGTTEFLPEQDKYVAARLAKEKLAPADEDHILIFSRTDNFFRYIPVAKIRNIVSLQAELDATELRRSKSKAKRLEKSSD